MPEDIIAKYCSSCKEPKGLDDFHRSKSGKLGRDNQCKACRAVYAKSAPAKKLACARNQRYIHSAKGKVKRAAYAKTQKAKEGYKRYLNTPHGRALHLQSQKRWFQTEQGKACRKKAKKLYTEKYPDKTKARLAVSHEIESKRLPSASTRYCEHCGKNAHLWHHHLGYEPEHWLDVIALCRYCDAHAHKSL